MTYEILSGEGLNTRWEDDPTVRVLTRPGGNPVTLEIEFVSAPEKTRRTRLTFANVFEYRWVDFDYSYLQPHSDDFEFSLIEVTDSEDIRRMINGSIYRDRPVGEKLGGVLRETDLHHYRIDFDDHGSYDVICTGLDIKLINSSDPPRA